MKGINWYGWANTRSGYGIVSLEYATALNKLVDVSIGWEREQDILPESFSYFTKEQQKLWRKPFVKERVGIIKTTPIMFYKNKSEFRIGYSMVEGTKIGKGWVAECNKMDAIFVPSPYLLDVFKECGVTVPIRNVKQGVNIERYQLVDRKPKERYIFGTIGHMDDRKNWEDLVRAFTSEFDRGEPVELWIKNANPYFQHQGFKDQRIRVINKFYTFDEIVKLYSLFDCFVFPSHAEGSGLPPREAMATGLPTIVTNWSGMAEIASEEYTYPLQPISIDHPDIRGEEQPGFMAKIDIAELMYQMRYCYEHQEESIVKGRNASEHIRREWNWDVAAKDLLQKAEELSNGGI